jgi:uncharacterized DUF497 family protein/uncharacterized protein (DUF4415 family)
MLHFDWDEAKNVANQRKHRVDFREARTAFLDDRGILISDDEEDGEERFVLLAMSAAPRLLVVCHVYLERDQVIRPDFGAEGQPNRAGAIRAEVEAMKKDYDFSKGKRNPYARRLKRQITIRLDESTLDYFKRLAEQSEVPYQTLINLYLRDCARSKKKLTMRWRAA